MSLSCVRCENLTVEHYHACTSGRAPLCATCPFEVVRNPSNNKWGHLPRVLDQKPFLRGPSPAPARNFMPAEMRDDALFPAPPTPQADPDVETCTANIRNGSSPAAASNFMTAEMPQLTECDRACRSSP